VSSNYPGISEPTHSIEGLYAAVAEMKQAMEIMLKRRGNGLDAMVTWQDLINLGLTAEVGGPATTFRIGRWQPNLYFGGGNTGMVIDETAEIFWVKCGPAVLITGKFAISDPGSSTGIAELSPAPFVARFAVDDNTQYIGAGGLHTGEVIAAQIRSQEDVFSLFDVIGAVDVDDTYFVGGGAIQLSMTYLTDEK
jgi:hypothetical protein